MRYRPDQLPRGSPHDVFPGGERSNENSRSLPQRGEAENHCAPKLKNRQEFKSLCARVLPGTKGDPIRLRMSAIGKPLPEVVCFEA